MIPHKQSIVCIIRALLHIFIYSFNRVPHGVKLLQENFKLCLQANTFLVRNTLIKSEELRFDI